MFSATTSLIMGLLAYDPFYSTTAPVGVTGTYTRHGTAPAHLFDTLRMGDEYIQFSLLWWWGPGMLCTVYGPHTGYFPGYSWPADSIELEMWRDTCYVPQLLSATRDCKLYGRQRVLGEVAGGGYFDCRLFPFNMTMLWTDSTEWNDTVFTDTVNDVSFRKIDLNVLAYFIMTDASVLGGDIPWPTKPSFMAKYLSQMLRGVKAGGGSVDHWMVGVFPYPEIQALIVPGKSIKICI